MFQRSKAVDHSETISKVRRGGNVEYVRDMYSSSDLLAARGVLYRDGAVFRNMQMPGMWL